MLHMRLFGSGLLATVQSAQAYLPERTGTTQGAQNRRQMLGKVPRAEP